MASQKSLDKLYTASTFTRLVDQVRDVREQLDGLKIAHPVLECTIGCLSGETIMIGESLSYIREYCMENKDIARRDPALVNDINSTLFATSVTLSDVLNEATAKSLDSINSLSSRVSRLLTSSDAKLRKYDGMDSFLQRLLGCSSALRVFYRMIDPFERRGLDQQSLSKYKKSVVSKLGMEMARRFGTIPSPPNYTRSLWPEHSVTYPLTSELMHCGLSQQQVQDIYQRSNQTSFVVKHALKRWRSYGSEGDHRVALAFVAMNGYDIETADRLLTIFSSHGKDIYGDLLKALEKADYKHWKITQCLSEFLDLAGFGQGEASTAGSAVDGVTLRHLHNVMVVKRYDFRAISYELASLRSLRSSNSRRRPMVARTRFTPVLYLRIWEHCQYKSYKVRQCVKSLLSRTARENIKWDGEEALLALCDYSFDIAAFVPKLPKITNGPHSLAVVGILQANIRLHSMPEILSTVRAMSSKLHVSWRAEGLDQMARRCNHKLDKMLDMQTRLEATFPASFVETNICWKWLAFNKFDLDMTLRDASNIPPGFLSWSSHDKQVYMKGLRNRIYYAPEDQYLKEIFHR